MAISREEFQQWGFRWPEATTVPLSGGLTVTITPTGYLKSRETWVATERGRMFLREYTLAFSNGFSYGPIDELRLRLMLGENPEG